MRRVLQLAIVIVAVLFCSQAHAACSTLSSGASQSAISSALNSCASGGGGTVSFGAGSYGPITSSVTIPCNVSLSGPAVPYSQTPNQTATINGSSSFLGWGFQTTAGCSQTQTIQYLAWNGQRPSNGGGGLRIAPGTTNLIVQNNWWTGVNSPGGDVGQNAQASLVYFDGNASGATTNNVLVRWNIFGSTSFGDCATAMNDTNNGENDNGGLCNGVGIHNNVTNVSVTNNIFHWLEQGMKTYEGQGACNPLTVSYNAFNNISRIMYETQCNIGSSSQPTLMYIQYNSWNTRYNTIQTFNISAANGCKSGYPNSAFCVTHTDYNVYLGDAPQGHDVGIEVWGSTGTTANYNLIEGKYVFNGIFWSQTGNFTFNGNNFNMSAGSGTNCQTTKGGFWNIESSNSPPDLPGCTGNTFSTVGTGTTPSVAPAISPASGSFTGSQTVTFTNPGTNRDTNTGIWYTTDGSTPVPGSGTARYIQGGGAISVTATTTVKAVGMWGAQNQPTSYPSGLGYVPSAVVSATYTGGGAPALTAGYQSNTGSMNTLAVGAAAIQQVADGTYSDSVARTLPDAYGNTAMWSSSNTGVLNVSSSGQVSCVGTGSANSMVVSSPGGVVFNVWGWTCTAPPTLQSVSLATTGGVGSVNYQATNQILATCHYSDASTTACNTTDSHGNAVSSWASSNLSYVTISGTGVATGVAIGSSNLTAVVAGITSSPALALAVTSSNTLVSAYLSGAGSCVPAATIQFAARCHYSTGTDQDCTVTDIYGDAVTGWHSSSSSLVSVENVGAANPGLAGCVAVGSATITATIDNTVASSGSAVTVSSAPVSLTGLSVATTGGATGLLVGSTNQLNATCTYSDGSSDECTSADAHGNVANTWTSTAPGHASVNAASGLATGVAPGTTTVTAKAGTLTSPAIPLTVMQIPSGVYTITITGPVTITGTVRF